MKSSRQELIGRLIAILLALITLLGLLTLPVYATDTDPNATGGGGSTTGSNGKWNWSSEKQGYRISIVDSNGNSMCDPVDLVYTLLGVEGAQKYWDTKLDTFGTQGAHKIIEVSRVMNADGSSFNGYMPKPMVGNLKGNGDTLREWLIADNSRNLKALLNYSHEGSYIFNVSGTDANTSVAGVVYNNGYKILFEPIVWFTPFTAGCTKAYDFQVYGTITNHSAWSIAAKQYKIFDDSEIVEYTSVAKSVGPWSLCLEKDAVFGSTTIIQMSGSGKVDVANIANNSYGYALHVYSTIPDDGSTHTYDVKNVPNIPGSAPDPVTGPQTPDINSGSPLLKYRIVKVYQDGQLDAFGNETYVHKETFIRFPTVSKILIEDEPEYKIAAWKYGSPYSTVNSTTDWEDAPIKNITPVQLGDSPATVDIKDASDPSKEVTLYVLLRKPSPGSTTHTFDSENFPDGQPHKAPDPSTDSETAGDISTLSSQLKYRIIKVYEKEIKDVNGNITIEHVITTERYPTLPKIEVEDETQYKLVEYKWGAPFKSVSSSTKWTDALISSVSARGSGTKPTIVNIANPSNASETVTLYVRLRKPATTVTKGDEGEVTITESQISKAVQTIDGSVSGWLPQTMTFTANSLAGTCGYSWYCSSDDCSGHVCGASYTMKDSGWHYYATNKLSIDTNILANVGVFAPKMEGDQSGTRGTSAHSIGISSFNMKFVIWRAQDIPTIASYKENGSNPVVSLTNRYGKIPQGYRYGDSYYEVPISIELDKDSGLGDYYTSAGHHDELNTADHININTLSYKAVAKVEVYWGVAKNKGNETVKGSQGLQTNMIGKPLPTHSSGQMFQYSSEISFYPYFRMTYMKTGDTTRTNVNVLSQWLSELTPNSYAEAAWSSNSEYNLNIRSSQWSVHSRATSGDLGWNYSGAVLPGGAIYSLDTKDTNTWVSVISWQPYVETEILNNVLTKGTEYTYEATKAPHEQLASEAKTALEGWRVVQHVKDNHSSVTKDGLEYWSTPDIRTNTNTTIALDGVAITGGGKSLSGLGLTGTSSTEDKYYLRADGTGTGANEGDIDILTENLIEVRYKVSSDVEGNIFVWRYRVGESSDWEKIDTLKKNQGADKLSNSNAIELDAKTKIVTNLVIALNRNQGSDMTAAWATSDGTWYNEAVDGLCVVRYETQFEVGYKNPNVRSAASDPRLSPVNTGQRDLYTKAFISQFFMNSKSDAYTDEIDGFIGTFKGNDIILAGYKEMFKSRVFSVSNVSVQDLN